MSNNIERIAAEKAFHNARFATEQNYQISPTKYYLALEHWYGDYFNKIFAVPALKVLELGSGLESLALQVPRADFTFDSIDISEEAVAFAEDHKRLKQARFSVDDAHHTKFADASFDLVIGRGIIHHLDIPTACREIRRILAPGGRVVFGEPLEANLLITLYRKLTPKIRSPDEQPLTRESMNMLQTHFGKLDITYYGFLTLGPALFSLKSPPLLHRIDGFVLNTLRLGRFLAWSCLISSEDTVL